MTVIDPVLHDETPSLHAKLFGHVEIKPSAGTPEGSIKALTRLSAPAPLAGSGKLLI
ncbi:hypothetical protein [Bacillus swezeyi]|uniref:hypothetical protein n=1 Tax=Bacillus swezeyi TaxID=1925020 RepID=UPI001653C53D|nr:hypothetical protein [Bacillus swezeyi]